MSERTYIDVRLYVEVHEPTAQFLGVEDPTPTEVMNDIKGNTQGELKLARIEDFRIKDYGIEGEQGTFSATKRSEERYQGNG